MVRQNLLKNSSILWVGLREGEGGGGGGGGEQLLLRGVASEAALSSSDPLPKRRARDYAVVCGTITPLASLRLSPAVVR